MSCQEKLPPFTEAYKLTSAQKLALFCKRQNLLQNKNYAFPALPILTQIYPNPILDH